MQRAGGRELMIQDLKRKIGQLERENREISARLERENREISARLERENKEISARLEQAARERDEVQFHLDETRKSVSYRLGLGITAVPRWLRTVGKKEKEEA